MNHAFEITLRHWPRDTKKADYKAISRWLRVCRNKIEPEVLMQTEKAIHDLSVYGHTEYTSK